MQTDICTFARQMNFSQKIKYFISNNTFFNE